VCPEDGFIETSSTLTSNNFDDSQLSADWKSHNKLKPDVLNEFQLSTDIQMNSDIKCMSFDYVLRSNMETNVKPGDSSESWSAIKVATVLPVHHAKVVKAQISADAVSRNIYYVQYVSQESITKLLSENSTSV